jgi:hypothetical protein
MKDHEPFAGRFSAEVDRILEQQGRAEEQGPPAEYAEMLTLAERLAGLDFVSDSGLQSRLRQRLLNRLEAERSAARQRPRQWRRLIPPQSRRALGTLVALVALVVLVGWTPAGRAVAQAVEQFILELHWPHTTVHQVPPGNRPEVTAENRERFEEGSAAGQTGRFSFEGRNFDFYYSEDAPVRDEIVPLQQAIAEAGFDLRVPSFLPDGFVLREVRLLDVAPFDVFMIYERTEGRLGLYQSFVGLISEEHLSENVVVVESREIGVLTGGTVEELMVGTTPAALIDGELLVWEENGISFHLMGRGLDAATLVQIAESLVPAQ